MNIQNNLPKHNFKKKGDCHYCRKLGHYKRVCRKKIADDKRKNNQNTNNHGSWNTQGNNSNNNSNQSQNLSNRNREDLRGLISAVQNLVASTTNNQRPIHPDYEGFMAKIKFRSNIAEISE